MSVIVEDGTQVANANSYLSVADADTYHTLYGHDDWAGTDADKGTALINATQSIELLYGQRYLSAPENSSQSLLFPRFTFVVNHIQLINTGTIPTQLKNAVAEVALMYLNGSDVFPTPNIAQALRSRTTTVGQISKSETYMGIPPVESFSGFNKIDLLLAPILYVQKKGTMPTRFRL